MPESTFNPFYASPLAAAGWEPEYGIDGQITGYWRPAALDPTRGANQQGVLQGSDYGFEYVPADKINGGQPAAEDLEYRTGGTSIVQNKPRGGEWFEPLVKATLAAMAAGTAGQAAGLWNLPAAGAEGVGVAGTGAMAPSDALLLANGEPIAGSGFSLASSGAPSFGTAFTPAATLSQAGEAAGSLFGLPNMVGVPGAVAGGALSLGSLPSELGSATIPGVNAPSATTPTAGSPPVDNSPQTKTIIEKAAGGAFSNLPDWLKALLPLAGGALAAYDAKNQPDSLGDPVSRDFLRTQMNTDPLFRLRPSYGLLAGYGQPTAQQGGLVNNQLFNRTGLRG